HDLPAARSTANRESVSDARKSMPRTTIRGGNRFSVRHREQGNMIVRRFGPLNITALALGLAFLYLPIAILVVNSFNDSRLVTVWAGASLRWYRELFRDEAMLDAASVSLRVALLSATAATVLGTLAALALTQRFRGKLLFS